MVKKRKKNSTKRLSGKGFKTNRAKARKINASTRYDTCTEQLSPFGGLLALIKFLDLVNFKQIFNSTYHKPSRDPKLGHHAMVIGILMLLFIGFNRIWHFVYVRLDAMLCGYLRVTRLSAAFITQIKAQLPGCVQQVLLRADGEFLSWESVQAAISCGFQFIIGNKGCTPYFDPQQWYRPWKRKDIEFNSCIYQPSGWRQACRFVAMRIPKEDKRVSNQPVQCPLFKDDCYVYRIFCTDLAGKAHDVIAEYDKRADVENLVGEAKREGLDAIPSAKFKNNYAFFQMVMLAFNIWRYMKLLAQASVDDNKADSHAKRVDGLKNVANNTLRIARLKMLFIAAKVVKDSNVDKVKYSIHDARTPTMIHFLEFLDTARMKIKPWVENSLWQLRFAL